MFRSHKYMCHYCSTQMKLHKCKPKDHNWEKCAGMTGNNYSHWLNYLFIIHSHCTDSSWIHLCIYLIIDDITHTITQITRITYYIHVFQIYDNSYFPAFFFSHHTVTWNSNCSLQLKSKHQCGKTRASRARLKNLDEHVRFNVGRWAGCRKSGSVWMSIDFH